MKPRSPLLLFSPLALSLLLASLSIVPPPTVALLCWTNLCDTAKWYIETCKEDHISCLAQYRRISSGDLLSSYFGCQHTALPSSHSCVPVEGQASDFSCACSGDLCNNILGVTPSRDDPDPVPNPQTPPPPHEDYLVCEFYNCSELSLDHRDCYYGYTQCDRNLPNNETSYCYARYNMFNGSSQLELETKGCTDVDFGCSDECIASNDDGKQSPIMCCCTGDECNVNVTFTHPERVDFRLVDPCSDLQCHHSCIVHSGVPRCYCKPGYSLSSDNTSCFVVDPCSDLQCHHSCIVHSGVPRCYCKPGYSLSPDNTSCVDINECNFNNGKCEINCINVVGSYHCGCPDDQRLSADGLSCEDTGLICHNLVCNTLECDSVPRKEYCDDSSYSNQQHCQATYKRYENGTFKPRLLSCFSGDFHCDPGVCVLSEIRKESIYYCCCDGNYCNLQVKFPNVSVVKSTTGGVQPSSSWPIHVMTTAGDLVKPMTTAGDLVKPMTTAGDLVKPSDVVTTPSRKSLSQSQLTFVIVIVIFLIVLIPVVVVGVVCVYCMHKYMQSRPSSTEPNTYSPDLGLSHLSFIDKIRQGRFAPVWRAKTIEDEIAVKVFPNTPECYESWNRESEIYETPELEHK